MGQSNELTKYRIEGLDCANCANEIEVALRRIEGFDGATVSFSTSTVLIPADRREAAEKTISRIEPEARLIDRTEGGAVGLARHSDAETPADAREGAGATAWRIGRIAIALVLTVAGVVFHDALHATPLRLAEYAVFLTAYVLVGWPVLAGAVRNIVRGRVFDEMFLMTIATLGAIAIHELAEAVAVMLFYSVGEYVQDRAVGRSRRSISSLMDLRPDFARLVAESGTREVEPEAVEVGSTIEVRPGERVPLDGEVIRGESAVDTSALTGESVPRSVGEGETVLSGFINATGTIRVRVTKPFADSSVSRILELVEDAAARKAPTEKFISRLARVYTPIVVGIAAAIAFIPPLVVPGAELGEWVYRALVMLVISCPCALVISIPLGYFGGIGGASRNGILVKGANFLDALTNLHTVVVDKTGTLTRGTFTVVRIEPRNGFDSAEILRLAAFAESHSTHPIARSILAAFDGEVDPDSVSDVHEERGFGVAARLDSRTILAGSDRLLHREGVAHTDCDAEGTVVYVAVDGTYVGYIVIADELKPDAASAVARMRELGVEDVVMLTGDNETIAQSVARQAGIDTVHAGLLPEEKVARVEQIAKSLPEGKRLAFVGDGINDAPVLMRADIGIAMGALGSDAAIEAADIVLMDDEMSGVGEAIGIARHTRSVVLQNIALALVVKAVFLTLGAFGIATMWEAVIADMGTSLLAVLNATRTLRYARSVE
ncbi:MAG: heavy metal translocating P-type ATPase [Spirochaetota bacterium]